MKTCDKCEKPATCNYQDQFVRYEIDEKGDYSKTPEIIAQGEANIHLCDEHDTADNYA